MAQEIDICEYLSRRKEEDILIDMRDEWLYRTHTIPGAVNIPLNDIRKLYALPEDRDIYVFCQAGENSTEYVELLEDAGYRAWSLSGGYRAYLRKKIEEEHRVD